MILFISFEESFIIIIVFFLLFGPNKMTEILRDINHLLTKSKFFIKKFKDNLWENIENIQTPIKGIKSDIFKIKDEFSKNTYKSIKRNK